MQRHKSSYKPDQFISFSSSSSSSLLEHRVVVKTSSDTFLLVVPVQVPSLTAFLVIPAFLDSKIPLWNSCCAQWMKAYTSCWRPWPTLNLQRGKVVQKLTSSWGQYCKGPNQTISPIPQGNTRPHRQLHITRDVFHGLALNIFQTCSYPTFPRELRRSPHALSDARRSSRHPCTNY